MHPLGELIKDVMDRNGWSTRDVEARGGPPYSTVARIINPAVPMLRPPGTQTLTRLAKGTGIPFRRIREAVAESLEYQQLNAEQSESVRTVVAAMSVLAPWAQEVVADVVLTFTQAMETAGTHAAQQHRTDRRRAPSGLELVREDAKKAARRGVPEKVRRRALEPDEGVDPPAPDDT